MLNRIVKKITREKNLILEKNEAEQLGMRFEKPNYILESHSNVTTDEIIAYEVEAITISSLLKKIGVNKIDFLKLDLEGAEYALIKKLSKEDLNSVNQLFV